jgi:hypothetical protein
MGGVSQRAGRRRRRPPYIARRSGAAAVARPRRGSLSTTAQADAAQRGAAASGVRARSCALREPATGGHSWCSSAGVGAGAGTRTRARRAPAHSRRLCIPLC